MPTWRKNTEGLKFGFATDIVKVARLATGDSFPPQNGKDGPKMLHSHT